MTIANYCVLAACLLPTLTAGLAKAGSAKLALREGGYDNRSPREWAARLGGWKARAIAAQLNGFEALPLFIAAVLMAQQAQADQARIDLLAMTFIALRLAYVASYLMNLGSVRTLIWTAAVASNIALLLMA